MVNDIWIIIEKKFLLVKGSNMDIDVNTSAWNTLEILTTFLIDFQMFNDKMFLIIAIYESSRKKIQKWMDESVGNKLASIADVRGNKS